jgi:SNF2 family DNA or RNA helicase
MEVAEERQALIAKEREHQIVSKLHDILRPFVLRRMKVDVLGNLPTKREYILDTPLTAVQRRYYRSFLDGYTPIHIWSIDDDVDADNDVVIIGLQRRWWVPNWVHWRIH